MKQTVFVSMACTILLAACVDKTGLSEKSSRPVKGNPNASVVVTEYADLQCPACRAAHTGVTKPLLETYGSRVRFEYKHFPLQSLHRNALIAAEASECAADQGKFWEFVDLAFEKQPELSPDALTSWGEALKLDMDLFNRCRKSHIKKDTILEDYEEGRSKDVGGTPTYFVNGDNVESGFDSLSEAIENASKGMMEKL